MLLSAAVDFEEDRIPGLTTFDEIRKGAWDQTARLADMAANHVDAAHELSRTRCPGSAAKTFLEREDKELAACCACSAYNDWMIDEWSGRRWRRARLLPVTIVPLWDADLAAD